VKVMEDGVTLVRGRRLEHIGAGAVGKLMRKYAAVVVDIGTGDGRWLYRFARGRADALCLGIDANAERLREVSFRAARKPARGGLANVRFILASAEAIPTVLHASADEVWVVYPWGSLLRGVTRPEPSMLLRIARVLKAGGVFTAAINVSALGNNSHLRDVGRPLSTGLINHAALHEGYNKAGLAIAAVRADDVRIRSSWGTRLGQGRPVRTLWIEAVKDGDRRDHGRGRDGPGIAGPGLAGAPAPGHRDGVGVPAI
jgi:16S rRNA (adenine(1408)-N(1))-methyltransferase